MTYKAAFIRCLKIIAGIVIVGLAYVIYTLPHVEQIPDEAYKSLDKSKFADLLATPHKKLVWFGADRPVSKEKKSIITLTIYLSHFNKYYEHKPFLQNSLYVAPDDIFGQFIMKNCANKMCIVIPGSRKVVSTTEKYMVRDMSRYLYE